MSNKSLVIENQIYVEEVVLNRMVQIAKEAIELPESMTERLRFGYALMAIELLGIGVIDDAFYEKFCLAVYPEYWRYEHGYAVE